MERPRRDGAPPGPPESGELRSSLTLLERAQECDRAALEALTALDSQARDEGRSPLDEAIGRAAVERYERALATLRREDREAIVARVELGYTNDEIAELLGKPSANAARMMVERAIVKLGKAMGTSSYDPGRCRAPRALRATA